MIAEQIAYRDKMAQHLRDVDAELSKYSPAVRSFMLANFQLALYPLSFVQKHAQKLAEFEAAARS